MVGFKHFVTAFGPVAYLLILASIVILTISIERFISIYFQAKIPLKQLEQIKQEIRLGQLEKAKAYTLEIASTFQNWLNILFNSPRQIADDELSLIFIQKRDSLQRPLDWLNLFAIVSPMLGLLGTIWSMSKSFDMIAKSISSDSMQMMITYLSEAMYATAFGIVLALVSMLNLYILRQKSDNYLSKCEYSLNQISIALEHNLIKESAC